MVFKLIQKTERKARAPCEAEPRSLIEADCIYAVQFDD